jgi:hypothetical protein
MRFLQEIEANGISVDKTIQFDFKFLIAASRGA